MSESPENRFSSRVKEAFSRDIHTSWTLDVIAMFTYATTLGASVCLLFRDFPMPDQIRGILLISLVIMNFFSIYYLSLHSRLLVFPLCFSVLLPLAAAGAEYELLTSLALGCSLIIILARQSFFLGFCLAILGSFILVGIASDLRSTLPFYVIYGGLFLLVSGNIFPWHTRYKNILYPRPRARMMNREQRRIVGRRGFTLIEMLIVVAMIGITTAGVVKILAHHNVSSDYLANINKATLLASSEMETLVAGKNIPEVAQSKVPVPLPPDNLTLLGQCRAFMTVSPGPREDLVQVTVIIKWEDRSGVHEHSLERLFERSSS